MADYSKEVNDFQLDLIDKLVLEVTPDKAIEKANELVHLAVDMDMTGAEKFKWVVDQIKPTLEWLVGLLAEVLVQLLYNMMMGYKEDLINGN